MTPVFTPFGTAGTGGFTERQREGAYNSAYIDIVTGIGMLAFGVNFNLYYFSADTPLPGTWPSPELWAYLGIVAFSTVTIAANIRHLYGAVGTAPRLFPGVLSIITTTGFMLRWILTNGRAMPRRFADGAGCSWAAVPVPPAVV